MTYKDFLEALAKSPRDWEINEGRIRRYELKNLWRPMCPLTALTKKHCGMWPGVARDLKIPDWMARSIVDAADNDKPLTTHQRRIRRDLLRACGLEEAR